MSAPVPSLLDLAGFQALAGGDGLEAARLAGIVRDIRDYCGWHIAPAVDETLIVDGSGGTVQQLPTLRLNSVTSITENGTALEADRFEWSADGSIRRCAGYWTPRYRGVVAVVNHGYAEVPENIVSVIVDATSTALAVPVGEDKVDDQPETMGPFTWGESTAEVDFTAAQLRVLDRYKIPGRP